MKTKRLTIKVGSRTIGGDSFFFVIEEGQANLGSLEKALRMIDAAAGAGADAIEFQLAKADDFYVKNDPIHQLYLKREFTDTQLKKLICYTKSKGLEFIVVPLSHRIITNLSDWGCSAFNINASDLTNPDIIDAVINTKLPFFLSLLMASEKEMDWVINRIKRKKVSNYLLLNGQHSMASSTDSVDAQHTALGYLAELKKKRRVLAGYIDHTAYTWMPAAAVCAGADLVSKHLCLARAEKGPDWQVCLEPEEMKLAITWARKMRASILMKSKTLAPGENMDKAKMRRSIVAAKLLTVGAIIKREDIIFKRPGNGICPSLYEEVVGRKIMRNVEVDEQIAWQDMQGGKRNFR